jgi:radical SAM protein with 4Fe4S-binding SPASM domain
MHENRPLPPTVAITPTSAAEMAGLWRANRRALADDHLAGRELSTGKPAHLKIELTNYCNLACPMCPHQQMTREVGYMRPELFRRIIDQAVPELEFAYLHHLGESLFHGKIGEFIRYGRERGVAMGLSTNATYLDQRKARSLLDSGLDFLVISMDAASPDTYDRIRVGGDFATTVGNVRDFFALKRALKSHTTVVVQMIVTAANQHEIGAFAELWRSDGAQVMIKEARDWAGQVKLLPLGRAPLAANSPCKMLWTELTVLWDGAVVPCVNVYERENLLGDLSQQTLAEVWNGAPLRRYRAAHLADAVADIKVCNSCPRHRFEHRDFVAVDQLQQRLRNYVRADLTPQPGLS